MAGDTREVGGPRGDAGPCPIDLGLSGAAGAARELREARPSPRRMGLMEDVFQRLADQQFLECGRMTAADMIHRRRLDDAAHAFGMALLPDGGTETLTRLAR